MLTIYRRHRRDCLQRSEPHGRDHVDGDVFVRKTLTNSCRCTYWVDGFLAGREIRKTLRTQNLEKAKKDVLVWDRGERSSDEGKIAIKPATEAWIADAEDRNLAEGTIRKYRRLSHQLTAFADCHGIRFLTELDVPMLRNFRASWKDKNLAALKKLERLRGFFKFSKENGWVSENPAKKLGKPKCDERPTLPFSDEEMNRILAAAEANIRKIQAHGTENAIRLRALVLLLRYSGLRIGDAVGCSFDRLAGGKLRLYTQKTGTHVHCPLPDFVVDQLDAIPKKSARYWFWTGNGKLQTAVTDWQGRLQDLFIDANVQGGHAHRFRDTFAIKLLLEGVPIERVAVFLGQQNVKVTQKHYSPWVRERQEQAEADVRRTWERDPIALLAAATARSKFLGTPQVHEVKGPVN
jgi:site-specific recombinase XerD